ncbi:MAG: flavin reductase family protein [Bacteroidetes bacterium]|nr:flavin reductase family protein [Bacteroidota bacterium]MDA0984218.1 flavin reductase family protein [Bacteroidota bacterium]
MHYFQKEDLEGFSKIYRLNLINSVTGYKSAHLLGTVSPSGFENLAVFSSVVHLGSNPALLGFILRPTTVPRHSHANMKAKGIFTLNAISKGQIEDAHHTSAKYSEEISEFDQTQLKPQYKDGWEAPYVHGAPIQMGCRYLNEYPILENDTILIVAQIEHLYIDSPLLGEDGWVQLDQGEIVSINGLDGYALPALLERFVYARPKK